VRLIPTARPGSSFARWLGPCDGGPPICTLVLPPGTTNTTARFGPVALYLGATAGAGSVEAIPGGAGCGTGCMLYGYGTPVTLAAHPCCGYGFAGWSGSCAGAPDQCSVTMFDTVSTTPLFACVTGDCIGQTSSPLSRDVKITLSVSGSGSVAVNGKRCQGNCQLKFNRGTTLFLSASKGLKSWGGWCAGSRPQCQFPAVRDARNQLPFVAARF
jgi:Divergent InlB B-repeat domain